MTATAWAETPATVSPKISSKQRLEQGGEERLTDEAQADAGHGDAELGRREIVVEVGDGAQGQVRQRPPLSREVFEPCAPHRHYRELGSDEHAVEENERQHEGEAQGYR